MTKEAMKKIEELIESITSLKDIAGMGATVIKPSGDQKKPIKIKPFVGKPATKPGQNLKQIKG